MVDASGNKLSFRREYWVYFSAEAAKGGDCPLYEHLALAIADDAEMQAVTLPAQLGQPPANMLFAAVHFVLLGGAEHPLRLYYPHLLKPGEPVAAVGPETYGIFQDFVSRHRAALDPLIAGRVTNTNEVRRCGYLRTGYAEIAARTVQKLHIVELGPSAGLNLNWDRYAYVYAGEKGGAVLEGGPASSLTIECEWRGETPPPVPAAPPAVAHRVGLELNPVDLGSEADRRWLVALIWPGLTERIERQREALAIAVDHKPPIKAGDALANLPAELAGVAPDAAAVVIHSMVTYQWHDDMRARLDEILREASQARPVYRLFQDTIHSKLGGGVRHTLRLYIYRGGEVERIELGEAHHHGTWLRWEPQAEG